MYSRRVEDILNTPEREVPNNDHDAVIQLWTAFIGTNGSGFITKFEAFKKEMREKLEHTVTHDTCAAYQKKTADKRLRKVNNIYLAIAIVSLLFAFKDFLMGLFI